MRLPLLADGREAPAMDTDRLEQLLVWGSQLAEDFPEVTELDLNPVVPVSVVPVSVGVAALDVKLRLQPIEDQPDPHLRSLATGRAPPPNH
jgi:hypothetical protein